MAIKKAKLLDVFNKPLFWVILIVVNLLVIYLSLLWGYQTSRLSSSFDNFVQESGIWRLFGQKNYNEGAFIFDPSLNISHHSIKVDAYSGYLNKVNIEGEKIVLILNSQNKEDFEVEIPKAEDGKYILCQKNMPFCHEGSVEDLTIGDLVWVYRVEDIDEKTEDYYLSGNFE
ncbi:hypothetical protein JW710_00340 [Candidatus Dojkabacteria bacterium]|nr:hypothetical protein [Candidatus Dojkabacteria bacterium]